MDPFFHSREFLSTAIWSSLRGQPPKFGLVRSELSLGVVGRRAQHPIKGSNPNRVPKASELDEGSDSRTPKASAKRFG